MNFPRLAFACAVFGLCGCAANVPTPPKEVRNPIEELAHPIHLICKGLPTANANYPLDAYVLGLSQGSATVEIVLSPAGGRISTKAISASHPVFEAEAIRQSKTIQCQGTGRTTRLHVPFRFKRDPDGA